MVTILNDISNQLRNTSDSLTYTSATPGKVMAVVMLSISLGTLLLISTQALYLKKWLSSHMLNCEILHNAEEEARKRELYAQGLKRWAIPSSFGLLLFFMQLAIIHFFCGVYITMRAAGNEANAVIAIPAIAALLFWWYKFGVTIKDPYSPFVISQNPFHAVICTWTEKSRSSLHEDALDPEIARTGIANRLFTHTSMISNNLSIFIQLFNLPVEYPRLRIKSIAPWSQLSSLLPSMLMKTYSHSRFNLLPALRLCLLVCAQGQSEQLWVTKEAKRAYSTIKTSVTLQNLYLHLLSQLHATAGDTDHWQDACQILKCLEYSEEHTSELVWLIDSIQLYTLWIEEDFTTRIVEFLRGVVVYLGKCPSDVHNSDLLRTATIMVAEWLVSRQSSDNGNLLRQYILSSQDVHSGEGNRETFVLVNNRTLSSSESLQHTIRLYQASQEKDSSSDFAISTLLIPIMAIEGLAAENNRESISYAVPRIRSGDLPCSLEGLWDLWEGGFNQSDLFRFVLTLVVPPPSPVGDTQSSTAILLLKEYLQQINGSPAQITEKAFRFIDAAFEHSLTTGTTRDELDLQLQNVQCPNPWLTLHIDKILRRRSTPCIADLEAVTTLDSRVKAIVTRKRLNLYI